MHILTGHIPYFNSFPNDKHLDMSKLKAFADNKIKVTDKLKFVLRRVEQILGCYCLGFNVVLMVFQLFNTSQIHVSWTIF